MGSNDRPPFSYNGCRLYSHYTIQTVLNGNNEITPTIPITINCDKLDVIATTACRWAHNSNVTTVMCMG